MPTLKNKRHEKFALALFKGMSQKDAAIEAGYKPSRARQTAHELVTKSDISIRIKELAGKTEAETVMTVKERKERLSELGREEIKKPVTAKEVVLSVAELSKLSGDYPPSKVEVEPGKDMAELLKGLLGRLRGYGSKDKE